MVWSRKIEEVKKMGPFKNSEGKEITVKDIQEGMWIEDYKGSLSSSRIKNSIPKKCNECGFPAMNIISRDFGKQRLTVGCPYCFTMRELCMVCGKMKYLLDSPKKHKHRG